MCSPHEPIVENLGLDSGVCGFSPGINVDIMAEVEQAGDLSDDPRLGDLRKAADDERNLHERASRRVACTMFVSRTRLLFWR
jgi:hypothetical protein